MKQYSYFLFFITTILLADTDSHLHNYLWANYMQFGGNEAQAQQWYAKVNNNQSSIFSNKGYIHFLHDRGDFEKITQLIPKVEQNFKNDPDLQLIFFMALKKTNKIDKADEKIIMLSQDFKMHPEIIFNAAETFVRRKETQNALSLIDDYLNNSLRRPNNFIFYFLKAQILMQLQDFTNARANVQLCLDAHPRFAQGWLLLAMLEEQAGQLASAIKGFSSYLEIAGPNKQIEQHLLQLALRQKSMQDNRQLLFVNKSCLSKVMLLFERKEYRAALAQIDECLSKNPKDTELRLLKIEALNALNDHDELLKTLIAWADQEPSNHIWFKTLHLLSHGKIPLIRLINAFHTIQTHHPTEIVPSLYLADLLTKNGDRMPAISCHKKILALSQDPGLKTQILYQIALLQYEERLYPAMIATLKELSTIAPSYAAGDNLAAYYYATAGNDLKKAQYYFDKVYKSDKGNPHFLDTQAVIYYKQKEYAKAVTLLQPLAQQLPEDSSILIHLAKSYYKLGKKDEAFATIKNAHQYAYTPYEKKVTKELLTSWQQHQPSSM